MNKSTKILIAIIAIVAIIAVVVVVINSNKGKDNNTTSKLGEIKSAEDLEKLVDKLYDGNEELPRLMTMTVEVNDSDAVEAATGLSNGDNLEYLVVSEPMMNAQAYSLVLAKVKSGVDANKIAKEMSENVNMRKWICVSAEKLYATNSGDVVFLVMSSEEWAKPVYNKFKELAGSIGQEHNKEEEVVELPEDVTPVEVF